MHKIQKKQQNNELRIKDIETRLNSIIDDMDKIKISPREHYVTDYRFLNFLEMKGE